MQLPGTLPTTRPATDTQDMTPERLREQVARLRAQWPPAAAPGRAAEAVRQPPGTEESTRTEFRARLLHQLVARRTAEDQASVEAGARMAQRAVASVSICSLTLNGYSLSTLECTCALGGACCPSGSWRKPAEMQADAVCVCCCTQMHERPPRTQHGPIRGISAAIVPTARAPTQEPPFNLPSLSVTGNAIRPIPPRRPRAFLFLWNSTPVTPHLNCRPLHFSCGHV